MHEHRCALDGSTFSVNLTSDKTGAYQSIFVADANAASTPYWSAFWTETRGRTGYANVSLYTKNRNILMKSIGYLLLSLFFLLSCTQDKSVISPDDQISLKFSCDVTEGNKPFVVNFKLILYGNINNLKVQVPPVHFNSGSGKISDIVIYSLPDTFTYAQREYNWSYTYDGRLGIMKALSILKLRSEPRLIYSDTLYIKVNE